MTTKNIVFLHPDLGIGGAERLAIDAALALKSKGHQVEFVTSYHNKGHCFDETKNGELDVTVIAGWLPRNICGRFYALMAYFKMIFCAFYIILFKQPDIVFCDLVSACIPILKLGGCHVIFYCHFPDRLLSKPEGMAKHLYRIPLNWLEEITTSLADKLYVNSKFTQAVFTHTFSSIKRIPEVLYPSINTKNLDYPNLNEMTKCIQVADDVFVFLSIGRFERKKGFELAIKAMNKLKSELSEEDWSKTYLLFAGGSDERVQENREYSAELTALIEESDLSEKIGLKMNPTDQEKAWLLKRCGCLIYTPANEHFGIVPLEAMYFKKPVIACNSGGPTETVVNNQTGFLCDDNEQSFSIAMKKIRTDRNLQTKMGQEGYERFNEKFSFTSFASQLNSDVEAI